MFRGRVIHGDGKGKTLGYPTANIDIPPQKTKLKDGIYAVYAHLNDKRYKAAAYINSKRQRVEVYLLYYRGPDFYGSELGVDPIQKVSEIVSVHSEEELIEKIKTDIKLIKAMFRSE